MKATESNSRLGVGLLTAGHFFNDFYANFLPVLLPLIMPKLGLTLTLSGLLIMIMSFTSNVMQPLFGYFIDRRNWQSLLITAVPFGAVTMCSLSYVDNTLMLFILIAVTGFAVSLYHPLGLAMTGRIASPNRLGLALSIFVGGGNLGCAVAPLLLVYYLDAYGLENMPYLAVPTFILAAAIFFSGLHRLKSSPAAEQQTNSISLRKILCQKNILKLNLAMGLRCWTQSAVTMFLPVLMVTNGYSNIYSGIMLTVFLVGAAIGGLYGGYLGDKLGYKRVITASLTLGILPTIYFFTASDMSLLTAVALFFCGAGLQTSAPGSIVWARRLMPGYAGIASGMMLGLAFGIGGIGSAITGALGDIIGLHQSLALTIIPLALAAGIVYTTPEK